MIAEPLPSEFAAALAATVTGRGVFGARLTYAGEVGSTNDLAAAAAERGDPEGTTFVAGAQTAGRGRLGRGWFSPPGAGLYVSTIVRRASGSRRASTSAVRGNRPPPMIVTSWMGGASRWPFFSQPACARRAPLADSCRRAAGP